MGSTAYYVSGSSTTDQYAAKICADYRGGGNDGWFLPSKDELDLMYQNLKENNLGGFSGGSYWSSSVLDGHFANSAWTRNLNGGGQANFDRGSVYRVRPVRAF